VGKTWQFIFATVDSKKLLSSKSNENKTEKVNTTGLPPVKRFLYSHIARPFTLLIQAGQVS
jgi:hypothetical protein